MPRYLAASGTLRLRGANIGAGTTVFFLIDEAFRGTDETPIEIRSSSLEEPHLFRLSVFRQDLELAFLSLAADYRQVPFT